MIKFLGLFLSLLLAAPAIACTEDNIEPVEKAEPHWKPWLEQVCNNCESPVTLKDTTEKPGRLKNSPIIPRPAFFTAEVSGPSDVLKLIQTSDEQILYELVKLLDDPDRAYAAHLLLIRMLKYDWNLGIYSTATSGVDDDWWQHESKTGEAKKYWLKVLEICKGKLRWAPLTLRFISDDQACGTLKDSLNEYLEES